MRNWDAALKEHKQALLNQGFKEENILGIFCYGSQNYNLDTETSDWDTKAIVIPSFEALILERPVALDIKVNDEEHCEIKDIREMVNMFKKQNINFIEILYTKYNWVNPYYMELWNEYFISHREEIAHFDEQKTVLSIVGQAIHTLGQNIYNGKKVANGYRLYIFLQKYLARKPYEECITLNGDIREFLLELKRHNHVPRYHCTFLDAALQDLREQDRMYINNFTVEKVMEDGMIELIKLNVPK